MCVCVCVNACKYTVGMYAFFRMCMLPCEFLVVVDPLTTQSAYLFLWLGSLLCKCAARVRRICAYTQ